MDASYNFLKKFKIFEACDEGGQKNNLDYVHFRGGYAYASNAHIIVRVPLRVCTSFGEDDYKKLDGFSIHASLLKMLMQYDVLMIDEGVNMDENGALYNFVELQSVVGENDVKVILRKYIDKEFKIPNFEEVINTGRETEIPITSIGFRIKFLKTIAAAMGQETIFLRFTKAAGKVYVIPEDEYIAGTIGVIMPVYQDGELPFDNR